MGISSNDIALAKSFYGRGKRDLNIAKELLENEEYADSSYYSQQSAEKIVKVVLILEKKFVREHVISDVLKDVINNAPSEWKDNLKEVLRNLISLEEHWVRPRYPFFEYEKLWDPLEEYTEKDAKDAIEKAKVVLETITNFMREYYNIEFNPRPKVSELRGKASD